MKTYLVTVTFEVQADTPDNAHQIAADSIETMLEVANDAGAIVATLTHLNPVEGGVVKAPAPLMIAPGPWRVAEGFRVVCVDHGREYALARAYCPDMLPEANANHARMMAASLDMLTALRRLTHPQGGDDDDVTFALAVVARAEGRA